MADKRFPASQAARLDNPELLFFLANLWHEIEDRDAVLLEVRRVLGRGGRIAVLDWRPDVEPLAGPPLLHRIAPADAVGEMLLAGFEQIESGDVGKFSWMALGKKAQ